ncbi:hypothetical protein PGB34_13645 [Xenophilus arseniciresistens]|uniref:Uncharacterized protein n=1 Tax=Xenophilus arseniciresistens TaxID=1283306 RepID=A0AAE3N9G0_9BURK|nr:hypothetical protein [Xenophilus arseniciresistens]MDA7417408.1 hypothetical protein [Xenophilus arseniciresistens]
MRNVDFAQWQQWMLLAVASIGLLALIYWLGSSARERLRQKRRILAARVRSGHAALDMPSTHGELDENQSHWGTVGRADGQALIVDEQPTIQICYRDAYGKAVYRLIEVEQLDLHRQAIVAKGNSLYDPRIFPLERIVEVRNSATGKPFNLGLWVEAVRVARRRRAERTDLQSLDGHA